jgi:hypothetical protein
MLKQLLFVFAASALAVASAKTYPAKIYQASVLAGTELKPGDYELSLKDTNVALKGEWVAVQSAARVEKTGTKFTRTSLHCVSGNGPLRIQEIKLGGTDLKLAFE